MRTRKSTIGGSVFKIAIGQPEVLVVIHPSLRELSPELPLVIAKEVDRVVHDNNDPIRFNLEHVVKAEAQKTYRYPGSPEGPDCFRLRFHFCCGIETSSWNREYKAEKKKKGGWEITRVPERVFDSPPCH